MDPRLRGDDTLKDAGMTGELGDDRGMDPRLRGDDTLKDAGMTEECGDDTEELGDDRATWG